MGFIYDNNGQHTSPDTVNTKSVYINIQENEAFDVIFAESTTLGMQFIRYKPGYGRLDKRTECNWVALSRDYNVICDVNIHMAENMRIIFNYLYSIEKTGVQFDSNLYRPLYIKIAAKILEAERILSN